MDAGSDSHYRGVTGVQLWWWGAGGHQTSFDLASLDASPMREVGALVLVGGSMTECPGVERSRASPCMHGRQPVPRRAHEKILLGRGVRREGSLPRAAAGGKRGRRQCSGPARSQMAARRLLRQTGPGH